MKEQPEDITVRRAIEHVREHGDMIDADHDLNNRPMRLGSFVAAAGLGVPIGLHGDAASPADMVSYLAYVPATLAALKLKYMLTDRLKHSRREKRQEIVEAELDEHMDLVRYGKRGDRKLLLRWYGFDRADFDDPETICSLKERGARVAEFAQKYGIDTVAVAIDPAKISEETTEGPSLVGKTKRLKQTTIQDYESADDVLVCSPDELKKILETLEVEHDDSIVPAIITTLNSPVLTKRFEQYNALQRHFMARQLLRETVREMLEMESTDSHGVLTRFEDGSFVREKAHTSITVRPDGRVLQTHAIHDALSGDVRVGMDGIQDLARRAGYTSNALMLKQVLETGVEGRSRVELLSSLYLLLGSPTDEVHKMARMSSGSDTVDDTAVTALMHRLYEGGDIDVEDKFRKLFLKIACGAGAFALGFMAASAVENYANKSFVRDADAAEAYIEAHASETEKQDYISIFDTDRQVVKEYFNEHNSFMDKFRRFVYEKYESAYVLDTDVSVRVVEFLDDLIGADKLPDVLMARFSGDLRAEWEDKVALNLPPSIYSKNSEEAFVGDVQTGSNKVVYTIESLSGADTEGLWYNSLYTNLSITNGSPPFVGAGVEFGAPSLNAALIADQKELPVPTEESIRAADFMVETPYIGIDGSGTTINTATIAMPTRQDTQIVGARIIDKADETKVLEVPLPVVQTRSGETAYMPYMPVYTNGASSIDAIYAAGMERPVLQYWLKAAPGYDAIPADDMALRTYATELPDSIVSEIGKDVLVEHKDALWVAGEVKEALGLPAGATNQEVIAAVKDRYYSYTPFEREGLRRIPIDDSSSKHALAEIGRVLAGLESMNCNVASMAALLGTLDSGQYLPATGYREDGDGVLSQQEAHAFLLDTKTGNFTDPTPATFAPGETPRDTVEKTPGKSSGDDDLFERAAGVLLAASAGYILWRRRKQIRSKTDELRTRYTFGSVKMRRAAEKVQHELYADPKTGRKFFVDKVQEPAAAAASYVLGVTKPPTIPVKGEALSEVARRAVLRFNHGAVHRHLANQPESL